MGHDSETATINHVQNAGITAAEPYALLIEYIDEMGYVYVSCPRCNQYRVDCNACVQWSFTISREFWNREEEERLRDPPPVEFGVRSASWNGAQVLVMDPPTPQDTSLTSSQILGTHGEITIIALTRNLARISFVPRPSSI
ncbi:hypothetical protein WDU94_008055 [Cyamophila willieti]